MENDYLNQNCMDNPPDTIIVLLVMTVILLTFGSTAFVFVAPVNEMLFFFTITIFTLNAWVVWKEFSFLYVHRPVRVIVNDDGMVLIFRWSEPKTVLWDDIAFLHIPDAKNEARMYVKGEKFQYCIKAAIAREMSHNHCLATGGALPTPEEYKGKVPIIWRHI